MFPTSKSTQEKERKKEEAQMKKNNAYEFQRTSSLFGKIFWLSNIIVNQKLIIALSNDILGDSAFSISEIKETLQEIEMRKGWPAGRVWPGRTFKARGPKWPKTDRNPPLKKF